MKNKQTNNQSSDAEPTRHITGKETLLLWVRSGGRCAMCNRYLLEEPYFERSLNLGERAHIAGWQDTPGSPRSDSAVPIPERNKVDNLVLLCQDCHTIVDNQATRAEYPQEKLLEFKREHEERILHLTAMSSDRESTVLRVFGLVRGSMPEMAREQAMRTVIDSGGRYARFPLAVDRHSIEVDLSQLPDPEQFQDGTYWRLGKMAIDRKAQGIAEAVHKKHVRHLSIFALARIPLMIYLGYVLDDKVPVDLYQKHRGEGEGWLWPEQEAIVFEHAEIRAGECQDGVAVILSLSGTIPLADLPAEADGLPVFEIRPVGVAPNPNLFRSRATLDAFVRTYQDLLAALERTHKPATLIHLFPAAPITAAIACGRHLMRHVQPEMRVYDRIGHEFQYALSINER